MIKNKKAQAVFIVFVYVSVASLLAIAQLVFSMNINLLVQRTINHTRGLYAAEAGLICAYAETSYSGMPSTANFNFSTSYGASPPDNQFSVDISTAPVATDPGAMMLFSEALWLE